MIELDLVRGDRMRWSIVIWLLWMGPGVLGLHIQSVRVPKYAKVAGAGAGAGTTVSSRI